MECEKQFQDHTFRNSQGQFEVKYPLKFSIELLGESYEVGLKRFLYLDKKTQNK